jgi:hypothetical protein
MAPSRGPIDADPTVAGPTTIDRLFRDWRYGMRGVSVGGKRTILVPRNPPREGELGMSDPKESLDEHARKRRELLKKTGTATVAPAVALLLESASKPASAQGYVVRTTLIP